MSSSTTDFNPPYSGWRREAIGVVGDLRVVDLLALALSCVPLILTFSRQAWSALAVSAPLTVLAFVLIVPRIHGRPVYRWIWDATLHRASAAAGTSEWLARSASGSVTSKDLDELDLPGPISALKVYDGPPSPQAQMERICLVQDPEGWWTIVARLTHRGLSLQDPAEKLRYASALGQVCDSIARADGPLQRFSLYIRSVPDDGTERALWHGRHLRPDAELPAGARDALDGLEMATTAGSVVHEIFAAFRFREVVLQREAKSSGGGLEGRAKVIYRKIPELAAQLGAMGGEDLEWLTTRGLASALRSGFNLGDSVGQILAADRGAIPGTHPGAAGPVKAPAPSARAYSHDSYVTASYSILLPDLPTYIGKLTPLLTPPSTGVRRTIALHYEPIPSEKSETALSRDQNKAEMASEIKRQRGFRISRRALLRENSIASQEDKVSRGFSLVRVAGAASVTVPCDQDIDAHASLMEAAAREGGYQLMRLELAQPAGFVAAVLPLGIGLPRRTN